MMTEHGFSHTTLHSNNGTVKVMKCRDLNSTRLVAAAPDLNLNTRAFGISADGEFVSLVLPGEKKVQSCRCGTRLHSTNVTRCTCMCTLHRFCACMRGMSIRSCMCVPVPPRQCFPQSPNNLYERPRKSS